MVQVNGKLRDRFEAGRDTAEEKLKEIALGLEKIKMLLGDKKVKKVITVKDQLINIVI